ncbi:putative histone-lysine N-methyltransferase transcription regulator PHD family [Rosa chinensis]|uniref:Putative histone-lysine N-methyltransferase transcription regulator PHD family n=3 Tax=Rosa chinensis TaxID=74649 RepID=A0A2P6PXM7_ROSCH|nr:uncharacterized protein LOC112169360 isoform X1 [Rosa chinensis]PRQ26681.1 putative histone-lysine N-methyltransferase transcription regulator PHD family [Rosa chinensis]
MENCWMNKCNSTLPSIASSSSQELRNQMENAGYFSCPHGSQDLRPAMLGRLQDPLLTSIQSSGSHRSEHVNLGNSFLSLLSGSPSLLQRDFQDFSNSQPIGTSGKILPEGNNSILNGTQNAIPLSSIGLPSEKLSWKNLQSGADFCPNGSSKVVPSSICASNSVLHDLQSSDLAKVVICHMGPGNEKLKTSYASSGEWHSAAPASRGNIQISEKMPLEANTFVSNQASRVCHSASPADSWKACRENIHTSQKIPPEANSFISYQASSLWHGASPADTGKACRANIETSPKMPVEAYSFISNQPPSFMNGCPRVFCSTTSGYLLLSNTGLLGIVCSCHSFRMSAFKFCEHSGLYGVNPGDAIRMDSGETIAQWCKLYLLKFGIRIPADKNEWDWPEELSATASWMKSSVPMPKISNSSSDLVFSPGGSVSSKQSFDGVSLSKNFIPSQSLVISAVSNKPERASSDRPERNIQGTNNLFLKALTGTSQSNLHMADNLLMERAMSTSKLVGDGAQDGCQSISAYSGSMHNRTSSIAHSTLQERRIIGTESDFCRIENTKDGAFRDPAISNIELRLGQPYQLAQTSGTPDLSAVGPPLLGTVVNPMKSLFPQQMIVNRANCREEVELGQCDHFSVDPSNPSRNRDRNQLNHGINAFVIRNAIDDERVEKSSSNLGQNSVISVLTNLKSPSNENTQSKANNYMFNDSGNTMRNTLHSEPLPVKYDLATVLRSAGNSERQQDMSHFGSYKLKDNDKGLSFAADGSYLAKDLGYRICKEMEVSSSFNRLSGNGEPNFLTAYRNSCYSQQLSGIPLGTPDSRISSSYPEKVISFANSGQVDHVCLRPLASSMGSGMKVPTQAVSKGVPVSASTSLADLIPPFCREEFIGVHTHLRDDKLQVSAPRQMQEISKQPHALPSLSKNQGEGRFGCSSYMQHPLLETSASGKQSHKHSLSSKYDVSEAAVNPRQSGVTCRIGTDEGFVSMTGVNCCCHFSRYKQRNALDSKEVDLKHQIGQPSPRIGKKSNNVPEPSEQERCCHKVPCGNFHGSSSCAAYRNCLERNFESRIGSLPTVSKGQMGTVNSEVSMIFSPQFANSQIIPKDKPVSLDHKRKLSGEVPNNNAYHTSQWRDVPSKVKGVSDVTRVDRLANLFDATREDREKLGDTCVKCFNGTVQMANSMKEHEVSDISSGCSAPAVSQPSIEVNNMGSSTNDAGDNGCGSNFVVDEGSGIDKAWSSDDALESEKGAEFLASTGSSLRKVGPPKNLNRQSSSCLLDDLKLLNSLTWQKGRDHIPAGLALHDKDKHLHNLEQGLNIKKRKRELGLKLNASCPSSDFSRVRQENPKSNGTSQFISRPSKSLKMLLTSGKSETHAIGNCITQSGSKRRLHISCSAKKLLRRSGLHRLHNDKDSEVNSVFPRELNGGTNNYEIAEVSGGETGKRDCSTNAFSQFQIEESSQEDAKKTKCNSVDGFKSTSSQQVNIGHRKARPIVCGIYGELTDGSLTGQMSKPAKLVPLSRVLNSSRKCMLPKHCNSKSTSMRKRNLGGDVICNTYDLKTEKYNKCCNATVKINDTSMRKKKKERSTGDGEFHKELFSLEKQGDAQSEKDHRKLDGITHTQSQLKPKEIRKRSIYELTEKGEDPGFKSSSVSKISICLPAMKDCKLLNTGEVSGLCQHSAKNKFRCSSTQEHWCHSDLDSVAFCCVCGSSNQDEINNLLECSQCLIRVHQACYGVSKVPKGRWSCRPCRTSSKDIVCVLCGYGAGAMTQALRSQTIVESILRAWNIETESGPKNELCSVSKTKVHNSITMGLVDSATKQWVHMVCGLWTPETRCPNVDTMSAFDVSGVPVPTADMVCCMCKRAGGSCIQCRVENCSVRFHPWCAHLKGLLQTEVEGIDNENVGFYGRCSLHATHPICKSDYPVDTDSGCLEEKKLACARTEGYKGRKRDGFRHNYCDRSKGSDGSLVPQEQLNAWAYINGHKSCTQELPKLAVSDIEHDSRKEYTRYKQAKSWKHLVVYKSGIHALGLYTSRFISRDEMVVEYVGEIVGQRVADKRENEYQSGKKLQYKSACYFFRIDKEHIIDATCKGGIARFVNHSCSPNCVAKVISVRNEKKVVFLAERDIFPGEEITYDYHFNHEDEGKKIPCSCNSKNCRRYLN